MTGHMKILTIIFALCLPLGAMASPEPHPAVPDTLTQKEKMAQQLIESVNELSKTASKLTETVNIILSSPDRTEPKTPPPAIRPDNVPDRPRPYLGPDLGPIVIPEMRDTQEESPEEKPDITTSRQFFPFLSLPEEKEGESKGNYIWVPDSLQDAVVALLEGNASASRRHPTAKNASPERVLFRGDTLDMVIRDRNWGRFDRKLFNYLAVPKGIWGASLTASYGEINTENLELMSLLSDVNISGHIFSIKPAIHYFIRNNLALGVRLSYTEGNAGVESFKVDIDEDLNFLLKDVEYHSESYQAAFTMTRYLGLSPRSRFSLTNEVELGFASGNTDFRRPIGGVMKETHTTTMKTSLTYSPGVSILMMKNVSFDLSFGAFGLYLKSERQTTDGVKGGTRTSSGANFRFNIFNINFGIGIRI